MADEIVVDGGTPAPVAPVAGTPVAGTPSPTPAPAPANGSADWERQRTGLTADLKREREARQKFETERNQFQTELAAEKRRVQALAGVTPAAPGEAEADEVRQRFAALYPHLGGLTAEEIAEYREMAAERQSLRQTTDHVWAKHAKSMVNDVFKEVSSAYGGDLTEKQKDNLTKAYVLRAQADPEFLQRHEDGDPKLAGEFAKEWVETWFEPARRKITATEVGQLRRVPGGKDRSIMNSGEKKINVSNNDEVMDLLVAGRKERGGGFGRR
jgi:hypothetical protein